MGLFSSFLHSGSFGDGCILPSHNRARSMYFKMPKMETKTTGIIFPKTTCRNPSVPSLCPIRISEGRLSLLRHSITLFRCLLLPQMDKARKHPQHRRQRPATTPHSHNHDPSELFSMTTPVLARIYQANSNLSLRRSNFPLHTRISDDLNAPSLLLRFFHSNRRPPPRMNHDTRLWSVIQ